LKFFFLPVDQLFFTWCAPGHFLFYDV